MGKRFLPLLAICVACFLIATACRKQKAGACTLSCGGFGTGDPFVMTNYAFITEEECKAMGQDRGRSCTASYCPPTGNSNDCYQVYP